MKKIKRRSKYPLCKGARQSFRGYPVATIAFYGPTDTRATKVAVGIVRGEGAEPEMVERWYSEDEDVRYSATIGREILAFISWMEATTSESLQSSLVMVELRQETGQTRRDHGLVRPQI